MAVYKIFPDKDATIYSIFPNMNTGLDSMIESTLTTFAYSDANPQASRFLVSFDGNTIENIIESTTYLGISGSEQLLDIGSWTVNLRCFVSTATGLEINPTGTLLEVYPVSGSWSMGTGRYLDDPISTDGVSWYWIDYSGSKAWTTNYSSSFYSTGSYTGSSDNRNINGYAGGGTWFTGSTVSYFDSDTYPIFSTQSFAYSSDKDLNVDVSNTIRAWYTGAIPNNTFDGFIIKQDPEFVNNKNYQPELKFYSLDTNTIYPPQLEFKWNDFTYNTSSTISEISATPATVTLEQNPGTFDLDSVNIFRVNVRPTYPTRVWQTSSLYTSNYYLPTASYYAVKDLDTNEFVIDFDTTYTKISADSNGNFFKLFMSGLEPERYYKILIKSTIDNSTIVFDDNYYFKIING